MIHRTRFVYACCQKRFPALAEELVDERRHAVGRRVGVEQPVVERVPLPRAPEPDFEVVVAAPGIVEDAPNLMAEVSFDFEDERARAAAGIVRPPVKQLARKRVHAGGGLAGPDGPDDEHAGVEPLFGDDEPRGPLALARHGGMVRLADHQRGRFVVRRRGPLGQLALAPEPEEGLQPDPPDREDERAREDDCDAGRGVVPEADGGVDARIVVSDQVEIGVVADGGERQFERVRARRSDGGTDERRPSSSSSEKSPSRRDRWYGSDPAGRAAWACTCRTAPMPHQASQRAGSLPSTARRPGSAPAICGPWPNPKPSSDLRNPRSAHPGDIPLHKHPDVDFTPPDRQRAPPNGAQVRTPERRLERHTEWPSIVPSGRAERRSSRISARRRRQPVETAQFLDRRVVHAPDGVLDPCGPASGRGDGPGRMHGTWGRVRIGPVPEDRPRPVKRSPGARDPDGLDRQAILPQRLPEPAVPVPPRMERRRGVVAGIDVDEHGAAGVQRHGHPAREVAPRAARRAPVDPDGQ